MLQDEPLKQAKDLEYYVYMLLDPVTKFPFYIGKGKGSRAYKHLLETKKNTDNYKKWAYIEGLRNKNLQPIIFIIYSNLPEKEAYDKEAQLIKSYGRLNLDQDGILTNICLDNRPPSNKGIKMSQQTREAMSVAQKNRIGIKHTLERKITASLRMKGELNPNFGKNQYKLMIDKYGIEEGNKRWKKRNTHLTREKRISSENLKLKLSVLRKNISNVGMRHIYNEITKEAKKVHKDQLEEFLLNNKEWKSGRKLRKYALRSTD